MPRRTQRATQARMGGEIRCLSEAESEAWNEREAICVHWGGLSPEDAQRVAWDCVETDAHGVFRNAN